MDEASETESQGRNSKVDEDGSTIPAIITDEYFDEITTKCQSVGFNKLKKKKTDNHYLISFFFSIFSKFSDGT